METEQEFQSEKLRHGQCSMFVFSFLFFAEFASVGRWGANINFDKRR